MIQTKYYLLVSLLLNFHISLGQESTIRGVINEITQKHFQNSQNRGLAIGIIDKDSIQSFYFGGKYTNIIKDVGPNTLFEIGSVTKLFTVHIFNELEKYLPDQKECITEIEKIFFNNRSLDASIKRNTFSPNTDKVTFFNCTKNLNSELCSTGEQKSILLSIILAFGWMYKQRNIQFILLFDEISSHIDEKNMENFFIEVAKFETQAWYTGTKKNIFQVIDNKAFFIDLA